jgi:hypothetical protein
MSFISELVGKNVSTSESEAQKYITGQLKAASNSKPIAVELQSILVPPRDGQGRAQIPLVADQSAYLLLATKLRP